jgi:hypothetical protein
MKSLIVIFLLIFSTVDVAAFQVFGGGAASTLDGQNGAYYLDRSNHTGDLPPSSYNNISATTVTTTGDINAGGFIDGKSSFGSLIDDNIGLGVAYNLSASFQTYTSFDVINVSSDITASTSNGTLTVGATSGGEYNIQINIGTTAVGGPELEFGIFSNDTTEIASFTREISGVHHHAPVLINLSSNAAYNTYSTIERLSFTDSDEIWISEASSGANPFVFDMTFNSEILYPTNVEFFGVLYDGSSGHEVEALMFNYSSSAWVAMRATAMDFPDAGGTDAFRYYDREFGTPEPIRNYVDVSTKEAMVRINHVSTGSPGHEFRIDKVQLHDSHNSAAISFNRILNIAGGSSISVKIKSDLNLPSYFVNMHLHLTKVSN